MKDIIALGIVFSILIIPIATAQQDIFWDNIDSFYYWLNFLLRTHNWTVQNLNLSDVTSCTEALETDAQGRIVCGTDAVGGGAGVSMWVDGGTFLYPNTTYADNIIVYGYVKSYDWDNVSITESQISDLVHTIDTHVAGDDNYLYNDSTTMYLNETVLNETIDIRTNSTTYLPWNIENISGTLDGGNLTSILTPEDGDTYNVSENTGASPLTIEINFTNVSTFDSVIGRLHYSGGIGHVIQIEIFRYDTVVWENYFEMTGTNDFINFYIPVFDPINHVNDTNASVRFYHIQSGVPTHDIFIDYLVLVEGWTALTTADHDALGGRDNISNHPWALPINGSRNATRLFVTENVTASWFLGKSNSSDYWDDLDSPLSSWTNTYNSSYHGLWSSNRTSTCNSSSYWDGYDTPSGWDLDESNDFYTNGSRAMTGNLNLSDYNITDITSINLGDNKKDCYGNDCDFCTYYNGTALITENPCMV